MYLIAERLKRPMRNNFGGKWVSMAGLFPVVGVLLMIVNPILGLVTFLAFPVMMFYTWFRHNRDAARRRRKFKYQNVNKSFIGSWF
jgi:multidrug efflux pump